MDRQNKKYVVKVDSLPAGLGGTRYVVNVLPRPGVAPIDRRGQAGGTQRQSLIQPPVVQKVQKRRRKKPLVARTSTAKSQAAAFRHRRGPRVVQQEPDVIVDQSNSSLAEVSVGQQEIQIQVEDGGPPPPSDPSTSSGYSSNLNKSDDGTSARTRVYKGTQDNGSIGGSLIQPPAATAINSNEGDRQGQPSSELVEPQVQALRPRRSGPYSLRRGGEKPINFYKATSSNKRK